MKIWATLWVWQESHLPQRLTLKNEAGFQSFTFLAPVDTISKAQFLVLWKNPIWCKDRKNLWKSWVLRKFSPKSTLESTTLASIFRFWSNHLKNLLGFLVKPIRIGFNLLQTFVRILHHVTKEFQVSLVFFPIKPGQKAIDTWNS